jgi:hypothetical protein
MWLLLALALILPALQRLFPAPRPARRPPEAWEPEDVEAWLALIEPFPLGDPAPK